MAAASFPDRVADRLASGLRAAGVRHAFGMPGGEVVTFVDALQRADVRFVLARNETAAAMMAAGASAVGGAPGLLVTTLGPGLANAVNGVADAWQERTPLIVVSGVIERALRARYTHQVVDHPALLSPLVKASFEVEPESAEACLARALRLALTPPFGPVHLDLSPAIAAAAAGAASPWTNPRAVRPRADLADPRLQDLRARLQASRRPLVLAGFDAARSGAADALAAMIERRPVPVITTYKAKGLLDERHACSLGAAGLSPLADRILLDVVRRADLVLLLGYDPIEMRPGWLDALPDPQCVVALGSSADHAMHDAAARLEGDPADLLAALAQGAAPGEGWPGRDLEAARQALAHAFAPPAAWGAHAAIDEIMHAAQADGATVSVDSGAHRILLSQMWKATRPLELLQSAGWCTMGAALPLALGAALEQPRLRAIAVLGDGGLEMSLGELGTLHDAGVSMTVVVLQDRSLGLIALKQAAAGLSPGGVALGGADYVAIARAFGGQGRLCADRITLREELVAAGRRSGCTLLACPIEAQDYVDRI
ncbi:decarboxylase [Alsobacter soli]|uniref:Decarboxylase n=1 Tax=Alsobacter soli TaxID=2109933 RepID=A0A2T1HWI4_9HYPH|nr:thiamine pyrophosphate-binding protein [Alsobacter soli]PSC06057.1 decarboxylase [Alsobacter soli]